MFPSSGEGMETRTLLGPLERANLNQSNPSIRPSPGPGPKVDFWKQNFLQQSDGNETAKEYSNTDFTPVNLHG
jgi:hypothetical protein